MKLKEEFIIHKTESETVLVPAAATHLRFLPAIGRGLRCLSSHIR